VARARIASQVIRRLRRAGVRDARYDAGSFTVRFVPGSAGGRDSSLTRGGQSHTDAAAAAPADIPTVLELGGLLTDRSGSRRERRARMDRFVAGFLRTPDVPESWEQARPLLRPVLRGGTPVAADISTPLRRPTLPFLAEFVVLDQPETMTYVSADQLASWEVSADEVFAAARRNLSGAVLRGVAHEPTVVRFVDDGDAYWTSHLLLDGWLAGLAEQVGGVPVAFAPERGTLLVGADGSDHLPRLFAQAEAVYASSPRAITPMAYVSDAHGRTVPYSAPEGHPLRACVQRAKAVLAATEYARQAGSLPGNPVELLVVGSATDGWLTRAVWARDEPALLPSAHEVLAGDRLLSWTEIAPNLLPVPDLDPPRWQASAWPPSPANHQAQEGEESTNKSQSGEKDGKLTNDPT
jgi:hypothetical protein